MIDRKGEMWEVNLSGDAGTFLVSSSSKPCLRPATPRAPSASSTIDASSSKKMTTQRSCSSRFGR